MARFTASLTKVYSNTCQTLTVTDTSNYNNNTDFRTKEDYPVRYIFIRDLFGNILDSKNLVDSDTVSFDLTLLSISFAFLDIQLVLAGIGIGENAASGGFLPCLT